ncbi:MAG: hypothetical protein VX589_04285 [Myxococcota bacterium]|nr:hypothetical protein [Myxococcota bacterium]
MKPRVPRLNVLLLILAALVNMATLKEEGGDNRGEASDEVEWLSWKNQHRQNLTVTILPMADRLAPLDYDGSIFLQVSLSRVPERYTALPRWAASMMTASGEIWAMDGDFPTLNEAEGEPRGYDISEQLGRLCGDGETADDDCIPCHAAAGCVVNVDVDFCYTVGDSTVEAIVALTDSEGQPFSLTCPEDTDSEPCTRLRDWVEVSGMSLQPGLCDGEG